MSRQTERPRVFVTTQWTRVLQARGETPDSAVALGELCDAYYQPVFAFIRCATRDKETARDLTQDFFARLLADDRLANVDPSRGRFRSYLLAAVKNFLRDAHAHDRAARRNPGQPVASLQHDTNATTAQIADPQASDAEREFDRKWALAVLDRALATLEAEQAEAGKSEQFQTLKPWLTGDSAELPRAEAAEKLKLSEAALRVTIHRLRQRFRALIKNEIAATIHEPNPGRINEELQYLISILAS